MGIGRRVREVEENKKKKIASGRKQSLSKMDKAFILAASLLKTKYQYPD